MVAAQVAELWVGERCCGPPATANGGYACGAIAGLLGGGVEVILRRPPPLGRPLRLQVGDDGAVVHDGDELVAEEHPATVALAMPGTASLAEARRPDAPRCSRVIPSRPASPAGPAAAPAAGWGILPGRCPAVTCGRRRGRPTPQRARSASMIGVIDATVVALTGIAVKYTMTTHN